MKFLWYTVCVCFCKRFCNKKIPHSTSHTVRDEFIHSRGSTLLAIAYVSVNQATYLMVTESPDRIRATRSSFQLFPDKAFPAACLSLKHSTVYSSRQRVFLSLCPIIALGFGFVNNLQNKDDKKLDISPKFFLYKCCYFPHHIMHLHNRI